MNRSLVIPAGCCLFAFAALLAAFHGTSGRETAAEPSQLGAPGRGGDRRTIVAPRASWASEAPNANGDRLLTSEEAEQELTTLVGEYLRPWRQWETSPHRLYSRAAPRPIPAIHARIEMWPGETDQNNSFLVANIAVNAGERSWSVPCVVDRATKKVRLISEGQWLTEDEWLKKAPLPWSTKP